ncbi:MAG: hypothetical protein FRX48_06088 [Lasallia pustulata]|uniref:Uncharacterized protein n=1 Tax=Lasallia pustulata TaxID=136370 RepID=A0A5M8PMD9_9LECA|nr:MAG: hypothetical protein FRX48_06088 [Lasallia pustulata]
MDPAYSRHSRRSHPNLQHLSLLPLTPHHPLSTPQPTPSYLAAQSLPTTPSILSRSPSRTRPNPRSTPALHSLDRSTPALHSLTRSPLPTRSKSSTSLPHTARASHPRPRLPRTASSSSWLAQTAHLLTATTRASKGQTWLATRSSSTSLTAAEEYDPLAGFGLDAEYNGAEADDEYSPTSYRTPFTASRAQSRGDDLVEGEDEEGEEGAGEGEEEKEREREEGLSRRKRRESERVVVREGEMGEGAVEKPPEEGEGGWKDAAWLLSVATKIIT